MRKTHPDPEKKLQGIAYARALHKVRAFASGLQWGIRLYNYDGVAEITHKDRGEVELRYTSPRVGGVYLLLDPRRSEATVTTTRHEHYVFPILNRNTYVDDVMGGIEQATALFSHYVEEGNRKPIMTAY